MSASTPSASTPSASTPRPSTSRPSVSAGRVPTPSDNFDAGLNLVLLRGQLSGSPRVRELPSGTRLLAFDVRVPGPGSSATSVPVSYANPLERLTRLEPGAEVIVLGCVHRRFWRGPDGATGSSTEVVAQKLAPADDKRGARAVLDKWAALGPDH